MEMVEIRCSKCDQKFQKYKGRINEALKFGWKQYCSPKCQFETRLTGANHACQTCSKTIWRTPKETRASKTQRFFCSTSCAAIFNNNLRSEALPKNFCRHPDCNKQIPRDQLYCSQIHGAFSRKRTSESLKEEVLQKIKEFEKLNGRIPVKKEMYGPYSKARDVFGTWNKAVETAGFQANPVMFSKKYIAKDGHVCDSLAEKIIDEWLHSKRISHKRSVPYPKFKRMTCDFAVGKFFIEFFGLEGEHREYTKHVHKKRRLAKKYNLKLIEIKPAHLFPKNKLNQILNFLI